MWDLTYMKYFKLLALIYLTIAFNTYAEMTVREYKNYMAKGQDDLVKIYIKGLGVSSSWMITVQESQDKNYQKLYCQPLNLGLTVENYVNILDKRIEKFKNVPGYQDKVYIELELINGLMETFPCN